jgi:hypothetical protein
MEQKNEANYSYDLSNCTNSRDVLAFWIISLQLMGTHIAPSGWGECWGGGGWGMMGQEMLVSYLSANLVSVVIYLYILFFGQGNCV